MWPFQHCANFDKQEREFEKKYTVILARLRTNLAYVRGILQISDNPRNIAHYGKVHNEGNGLYAVDQRGEKPKLREARLYFYPDFEDEILYILGIGFKETQEADILRYHKCIRTVQKETDNAHQV